MQEQLQGQSLHVVFDEFKVVFRLVDSSVTFPDVQLQQFDDGTIEWFFLPAVDVPLADDVEQFLDTAVHQLRPAKEQAGEDVEVFCRVIDETWYL